MKRSQVTLLLFLSRVLPQKLGRGAENRTPATRPPAAHSTFKLHPDIHAFYQNPAFSQNLKHLLEQKYQFS